MELRKHPAMHYQGKQIWPRLETNGGRTHRGPNGRSRAPYDVSSSVVFPDSIYLTMQTETGQVYGGFLRFDSVTFAQHVFQLLYELRDSPLSVIGSIDIPREILVDHLN